MTTEPNQLAELNLRNFNMVARLLSLGVHHRQGKHPYASAPFSFDKNAYRADAL